MKVCGRDFVNANENLTFLWDFIIEGIKDHSVPEVDLEEHESLKDIPPLIKRKSRKKSGVKKGKPPGRIGQAMKNLIGLAGEIHAYRALTKKYGIGVVGPSCWKSDYSRYIFPENFTDDGLGCDFVIRDENRTYFIEVKATQREDESFELGSSEVELVIDKAGKRKELFQIIHVNNVLSENPLFRILPNPYDKRHKNKYRFQDAGLRIRYDVE